MKTLSVLLVLTSVACTQAQTTKATSDIATVNGYYSCGAATAASVLQTLATDPTCQKK